MKKVLFLSLIITTNITLCMNREQSNPLISSLVRIIKTESVRSSEYLDQRHIKNYNNFSVCNLAIRILLNMNQYFDNHNKSLSESFPNDTELTQFMNDNNIPEKYFIPKINVLASLDEQYEAIENDSMLTQQEYINAITSLYHDIKEMIKNDEKTLDEHKLMALAYIKKDLGTLMLNHFLQNSEQVPFDEYQESIPIPTNNKISLAIRPAFQATSPEFISSFRHKINRNYWEY